MGMYMWGGVVKCGHLCLVFYGLQVEQGFLET